jgi:hypothetical protein
MSAVFGWIVRQPGLLSFLLGLGMLASIAGMLKQCDKKKDFKKTLSLVRTQLAKANGHIDRLQADSVKSQKRSAVITQKYDSTVAVIDQQQQANALLVGRLSLPQQRETVLKVLNIPYTTPVELPNQFSPDKYVVYTRSQSDTITTAILNGQDAKLREENLIKGSARKDEVLKDVVKTLDFFIEKKDFWGFLHPKKGIKAAKAQVVRDTLR